MAAVCITVEQCKSWMKVGKKEFVKFCHHQLSTAKHEFGEIQEKDLKRALYEVCWHGLRAHLEMDCLLVGIEDVMNLHPCVVSLLVDVLSIIDVETLCNEKKLERDRFLNLLMTSAHLIPESLLKERLDTDTLENLSLIQSKATFQQKYVKVKTKLYYKQQKFNLLREESEGYSKLITELNHDFSNSSIAVHDVLHNIKSLIGCFNLDPNRVLDIILEAFECRTHLDDFFVSLLRIYLENSDLETICHVLGFKFHYYQSTEDSETPESLYKVAAFLIYHQLVQLNTLYPHLMPADNEMVERHKRGVLEANQYSRKLSIVLLSDKPDTVDEQTEPTPVYANNQKFGLCESLLSVGDWQHARCILDRLPPFCAVSHPPLAKTLCSLVHYMIQPLYIKVCSLPTSIVNKWTPLTMPDNRGIEQVTSYADLLHVVFPLLSYMGAHLSSDCFLMAKLLRIGKAFLEMKEKKTSVVTGDSEEILRGFLTLLDSVIIPSQSLLPVNCCMAGEIWAFVKLLKYEYRYRLYGRWKNECHVGHPLLIRAHASILDRAKYIMKRLSKENIKLLGRQLGKLSHHNPGVLFEYVLSQIQCYDNFIGPVVDSLKYLTALSYDVLVYCIIEALANPDKERMKHDGTNISSWLKSLATFSGTVLKKYQIDLAGFMQYIANQMKAGKTYDLLILREVVQKMAGIEVSDEITRDQLEAMSGGEILRQEGGYFSQVRNTKKSSSRLKETLLQQQLAVPLCILMAQQHYAIIFPADGDAEDHRHLKLVGRLYDQCQDTFVQFAEFVCMHLSGEELSRRLPSIDQLMLLYGVPASASFFLCRTIYASRINAKFVELRKPLTKPTSSTLTEHYIEAVQSVMSPLVHSFQVVYPPQVWKDMSLQLYMTFWSLSLNDLHVPSDVYHKQISHLQHQIQTIEESTELTASKKKKESEKCSSLLERLKDEETKQHEHVNYVKARLTHEKDTWFASKSAKQATSMLQTCLFPRSCFTSLDAVYCAEFLRTIHSLKTPNFSSLICYDRIFNDVTWTMTSCTENEAHRYGCFLNAVLADIEYWHADKSVYEKNCSSHPGFVFCILSTSANKPPTSRQMDYENFRHVCHKWHVCLTRVMLNCLESEDFIQMRNALIVLIKVLPHYPRVKKFGMALERRLNRVCQKEKEGRPDIYAVAVGYAGQLKSKRKTWVDEESFHQVDKKKTETPSTKTVKVEGEAKTSETTTSNEPATDTTAADKHDTPKIKSDDKANDRSERHREKRNGEEMTPKSSSRATKTVTSEPRDDDDRSSRVEERNGAGGEGKGGDRMEGVKSSRDSPLVNNSGRTSKGHGDHSDQQTPTAVDTKTKRREERKDRHHQHHHSGDEDTSRHHQQRGEDVVMMDDDRTEEKAERRTGAKSSPKVHEDVKGSPHETKRRKVDTVTSIKERSHKSRGSGESRDKTRVKSPAYDRGDRGGDRDSKEKKDWTVRKHDKTDDQDFVENKRHRTDDTQAKSHSRSNGEVSENSNYKKVTRSKSRDDSLRSRDVDDSVNHTGSRKSRKESPEKERRSDKHTSKKSSKHH